MGTEAENENDLSGRLNDALYAIIWKIGTRLRQGPSRHFRNARVCTCDRSSRKHFRNVCTLHQINNKIGRKSMRRPLNLCRHSAKNMNGQLYNQVYIIDILSATWVISEEEDTLICRQVLVGCTYTPVHAILLNRFIASVYYSLFHQLVLTLFNVIV